MALDQNHMEVRYALTKVLGIFAIFFGFLAMGVSSIILGSLRGYILGWPLVLFSFICIILLLRNLINFRKAVIVLNNRGIRDRRIFDEIIPWSEIYSVVENSIGREKYVILELSPEFKKKFQNRIIINWPRWIEKKIFEFETFKVSAVCLELNLKELLTAILNFHGTNHEKK
jgi:hypothetical protein